MAAPRLIDELLATAFEAECLIAWTAGSTLFYLDSAEGFAFMVSKTREALLDYLGPKNFYRGISNLSRRAASVAALTLIPRINY